MFTLLDLARVNNITRVLDVGCGPGLGTRLLCQEVPDSHSVIYAIDISDNMLNLALDEFSKFSDFNANKNNIYSVSKEHGERIKIDKDIEDVRKTRQGKIVKFKKCEFNNLLFDDLQFDAYISNLSINFSENIDQTLTEAFRVLKWGSVIAVSIPLLKDPSHSVIFETLEKYQIKVVPETFCLKHIESNPDSIRKHFELAGFKDIKIDYTSIILDVYTIEDYFEKFQNSYINEILKKETNDKKVKEYLETVEHLVKTNLINKNKLPVMKCMIILGFKKFN
jgi:ubiquinone/menaquinone biosynthesis C-methylase UbiE